MRNKRRNIILPCGFLLFSLILAQVSLATIEGSENGKSCRRALGGEGPGSTLKTTPQKIETPWQDGLSVLDPKVHPLASWPRVSGLSHGVEAMVDLSGEVTQIESLLLILKKHPSLNLNSDETRNYISAKINTAVRILSHYSAIKNKINLLETLNSQVPSEKIEEAATKASALELEIRNKLYRDEEVFKNLKALHSHIEEVPKSDRGAPLLALNGFSLESLGRLLEAWIQKSKGEGVNLNRLQKVRLSQIDSQLLENGKKFRKNALESVGQIFYVSESTPLDAGVPEARLEEARQLAREQGHPGQLGFYLRPENIDQTHFILEWVADPKVREAFFKVFTQRGLFKPENSKLALESANLRWEKARILGFKDFATYRVKSNMLNHPDKIQKFVQTMKPEFLQMAEEELAELSQIMKTATPGAPGVLEPWDVQFWARRRNAEYLGFDPQDFKPYFELNHTLEASLAYIGKMMGLEFHRSSTMPTWHSDVIVYEVSNAQSGLFLGWIYFDAIQRPQKPPNAYAGEMYFPGAYEGKASSMIWHPGAIIVNLPVAPAMVSTSMVGDGPANKAPTLMDIKNLQSLFHEVGHAIHFLVSKVPYPIYGSFSAPQDFLELPSQFLENFAFDPKVLSEIAQHYQTGEKPPQALLQQVPKLRHLQPGLRSLARRGLMTELDLAWHSIDRPIETDTRTFERRILGSWKIPYIQAIAGYSASNEYINVFGYEAQFYSYQWNEVLDFDLYRFFEEHREHLHQLGLNFRKDLLEYGGFVDPMEAYVAFRRGQPDYKSILWKYKSGESPL